MVKTFNIKIKFNSDTDNISLTDTLMLSNRIFNFISTERFKMETCNGIMPLHQRCYKQIKQLYPNCPSQIIIRNEKDVISKYQSIRSNKKILNIPPTKNKLSLQLDKRLFTWKSDTELSITTINKRIRIKIDPYPEFIETWNKSVKKYDVSIFEKNGEFFLSIPFEIEELPLQNNDVIGLDLGLKRIVANSNGEIIKGNNFKANKRKLRCLKRKLQSIAKSKKSKSAKRKLKKIRNKEFNHTKNYIHTITKFILKNTKESVIVLEDLSKIKSKNKGKRFNNRLSQIPFYQFRQFLTYKAPLYGKKVVTVNPHYTSQLDCRGLENGIRRGCKYIALDNKILDADINAANNIRNRYLMQHSSNNLKRLMEGQATINEPIVG